MSRGHTTHGTTQQHQTIVVNYGDTLAIRTATPDNTTIKLNDGTLEFVQLMHEPNPAMMFLGDVSNFGRGDTIKVDGVWTDLTARGNLITLTPIDAGHEYLDLWLSGAHDAHIKLDGDYNIHAFTLGRDGAAAIIHYDPALIPHGA